MRKLFLFLVLYILPLNISAQHLNISLIVRDINTHSEIVGVNIFVKGTNYGTTTDNGGRFFLKVPANIAKNKIVFQHVAYDPFEISLDSLRTMRSVNLQPRIIPLEGIQIEGQGERPLEIAKDIPQSVSIVRAKKFELRGYIDAGDLLQTDQSIQVEEEISGKKTIAIRGGNSDEVIVLYNGVKMNNTYDNVFDFSMVELHDIKKIEIIRGSNTALYGPEAFSGVVNIVPKMVQDYNFRFQQRLGTYRSGNWGLHLYQDFNRLHGNYSYNRGAYKRNFEEDEDKSYFLSNKSEHHTANINYSFSNSSNSENSIGAMWMKSKLDYENQRDLETLLNDNQLFSLKYGGNISFLKNIDLSFSMRKSDEKQSLSLNSSALERNFNDQTFYFSFEKRQKFGNLDALFAYKYNSAELDYTDKRNDPKISSLGVEYAELQRDHHGLVSIFKLHSKTGSDFFRLFDIDLSVRHDQVIDKAINVVQRNPKNQTALGDNHWNATIAKISMNLTGYREDLTVFSYLNVGKNVKFPTLFQQMSSPLLFTQTATLPRLEPEKNTSFEFGTEATKEINFNPVFYGWRISGSYFQNQYDNKFRIFSSPGIPISFYDNTQNAKISGIDSKASVFLYQKKVTIEFGLSKYAITEKAAFPFKSDYKRTMNFIVDHAGYSIEVFWFKEGEQASWLRFPNGAFAEVFLPDFSNIDIHVNKKFVLWKLKFFGNFSIRNLLSDETTLQGLAIRDRRMYLTFGTQL